MDGGCCTHLGYDRTRYGYISPRAVYVSSPENVPDGDRVDGGA
jgi:hypothetical protein